MTEAYFPTEPPIMPVIYDQNYRNALANLAYALDKNELSQRVFDLTTWMLGKNPYHYTTLTLRRRYLRKQIIEEQNKMKAQGISGFVAPEASCPKSPYADVKKQQEFEMQCEVDDQQMLTQEALEQGKEEIEKERSILKEELEMVNTIIVVREEHKNFQMWNHKHELIKTCARLGFKDILLTEFDNCHNILELDNKNYHCYDFMCLLIKSWLGLPHAVSFGYNEKILLTAEQAQFLQAQVHEYQEMLLTRDVRNNSRFAFLMYMVTILARAENEPSLVPHFEFSFKAISRAPQNESSWAYLQGLYELQKQFDGAFVANQKQNYC